MSGGLKLALEKVRSVTNICRENNNEPHAHREWIMTVISPNHKRDTAAVVAATSTRPQRALGSNENTSGPESVVGLDTQLDNRGPAVQILLSTTPIAATSTKALLQSTDAKTAILDRLQNSNAALDTLEQSRKDTAGERKDSAERKLEQARKKLQLLQLLGGDPKSVARQAKDIGKEIKSAAGEYSTAVKDQSSNNSVVTGPEVDGAATDVKEVETTATNNSSLASRSSAVVVAKDAPASDQVAAGASANQDTARDQAAVHLSPSDAAATKAADYELGQHDRDVLALLKDATNQVKQVLQNAEHHSRSKSAGSVVIGATQIEAGLDKAIDELAETIEITQNGGKISANEIGDVVLAPVVDIVA